MDRGAWWAAVCGVTQGQTGLKRQQQQQQQWFSGKESACSEGDMGELERFPGEGNGNPLLYSCLKNPMDRGA